MGRSCRVIRQQALNANGHVFEPPRGIEARADDESQIGTDGSAQGSAGLPVQGLDARDRPAGADPAQSLGHENSVVPVQSHHIGNGAKRNEVQKSCRDPGCAGQALRLEPSAKCRHQVERYADTRKIRTLEFAAHQIRIDHDVRIRQRSAGQMMIRDQYLDAMTVGYRYAVNTGNTVVDGQQQVGRTACRNLDDLRRQSVAEPEAIRNQVIDLSESEFAQAADDQCRAGRAISIEIADDDHLAVAVFQQQIDASFDPRQCPHRQQVPERVVEILYRAYPPRHVDLA